MEKKYKYKLIKEQDESPTPDNNGGGNEKVSYNLVLTPNIVTVDEVVKALENIDNYGAYISNLRNTGVNVNKEVEAHFGPSQRFTKLKLEKERGKPFPPKTKQAIDDFIKTLNSKPNLLNWKVEGDTIIFPPDKNPTKKVTQNIIDTVLGNANIDYNISEKEVMNLDESKLRNTIKEQFKKFLNKS